MVVVLSFVDFLLLYLVDENGFVNANFFIVGLEVLGFEGIDFFVVMDYFVGNIKLLVDSIVITLNFVDSIIGFVFGIVLDDNGIFLFIVGISGDFSFGFLVFFLSIKILNLELVV